MMLIGSYNLQLIKKLETYSPIPPIFLSLVLSLELFFLQVIVMVQYVVEDLFSNPLNYSTLEFACSVEMLSGLQE